MAINTEKSTENRDQPTDLGYSPRSSNHDRTVVRPATGTSVFGENDSPNRPVHYCMDERAQPEHVVTAFLRNGGEILLARRSDDVGTYPDRWGGISGYAEGDPDEQVWVELREETGLDDEAVSLVRAGRPVSVSDESLHREWVVHPYCFDVDTRTVVLSDEHVEAAWLPASAIGIGSLDTVPGLWEAYERIAPTVRSIAADVDHGATYLSVRALDVIRDRATLLLRERGESDGSEETDRQCRDHESISIEGEATSDEWEELTSLAIRLREARPSMAVLTTRLDRAMSTALSLQENSAARDPAVGDPAVRDSAESAVADARTVLAGTIATIERAVWADERAAEVAATHVDGRVLTLSRSGTVMAALEHVEPDRCFVATSHPGGEGITVATELAETTPVSLVPDAAVSHVLATESIDAVLVGADTILPDGRVVNKVGTRGAAIAADREGVPVFVVAASAKITSEEAVSLESGSRAAVYDGPVGLDVVNPTFDVTPADCVDGVVTERGVLDDDGVARVADAHRRMAGWRADD